MYKNDIYIYQIKYIGHLLNYVYLLYLILFIIIFVYCNESLCLCSANIFYISIKLIFNIFKY